MSNCIKMKVVRRSQRVSASRVTRIRSTWSTRGAFTVACEILVIKCLLKHIGHRNTCSLNGPNSITHFPRSENLLWTYPFEKYFTQSHISSIRRSWSFSETSRLGHWLIPKSPDAGASQPPGTSAQQEWALRYVSSIFTKSFSLLTRKHWYYFSAKTIWQA